MGLGMWSGSNRLDCWVAVGAGLGAGGMGGMPWPIDGVDIGGIGGIIGLG